VSPGSGAARVIERHGEPAAASFCARFPSIPWLLRAALRWRGCWTDTGLNLAARGRSGRYDAASYLR